MATSGGAQRAWIEGSIFCATPQSAIERHFNERPITRDRGIVKLHDTPTFPCCVLERRSVQRVTALTLSLKKRKKAYDDALKLFVDDAPVAVIAHVNEQKVFHQSANKPSLS